MITQILKERLHRFFSALICVICFLNLCNLSLLFANPSFSHTENGNIQINIDGSTYTIHSSDKAIGAFNSFGNQAGETINSIQASSDYTALFRVIGNDPSVFYGALNANSRIFLINHNGIVFGEGSQINAAGLVASTLDIANNDFINGRYQFEQDALTTPGYILNQGNLKAQNGGYVALFASAVKNEGTIEAGHGSAVLASGNKVLFLLDDKGFVSVEVSNPIQANVYDLNGNKINEALSNTGTIRASAGRVILSAEAAEEIFDNTINHSGVIEAQSIDEMSGDVLLDGGDNGIVQVLGAIDVSGNDSHENGGNVRVYGEKIGVGTNASIDADAKISGDGGKVEIFATEAAKVYGDLSAKGGIVSGDGGFVETSGKYLEVVKAVNVSAPNGEAGTWLLDPEDVELTDEAGGAPANITQTGAGDPGPVEFAPTAINTVTKVNVATVNTALDGGSNVKIKTASGGVATGKITVSKAILKSADGGSADGSILTLEADDEVIVNATIGATVGELGVVFTALGAVDINAAITTNGGDFTSSGTTFDNTGGAITTAGGNVDINQTSAVTLGAQISTAAGNVDIASTGGAINSVMDDGTAEITSNGDVTLGGTAIGNTSQVEITGDTNTKTLSLTTTDGNINVEELTNVHFKTINLTLNDAGAATTVNVVLSGTDEISSALLSDDGTTLTFGAGAVATNTDGRTVSVTTTGLDMSFADGSVNTGSGNFSAIATGGSINSVMDNGTAEISSNGNVTLSGATGIGATSQIEITGDANAKTLSLSTADGDIDVEELTNSHFGMINLTLADGGVATAVNMELVGAADDVDFMDDGTTLTLGTGDIVTSDGNRNVSLTTSGLNLSLDTGAIAAGTGSVALSTSDGTINVVNATDTMAEISSSGNVSLTAQAIGSGANHLEITGNSSADSTLTLTSTATGAQDIAIDVLTDEFNAISLTLSDAESNVDISLFGGDMLEINGAAALSTIHNLVLTGTDASFTYSLTDPQAVSINNIDAGTAALNITATAGNLTVNAAGGGIVATGASAVTLTADGGGVLTVNDVITSAGGAVQLRADDDVVFGAAGDVTSGGGNVTVKADFDNQANGTGGAITMDDGTKVDAGAGKIDFDADEDITLSGLKTTDSSATAVTLTSTSGGIVDAGETDLDVDAAGRLDIDAKTGVGIAGAFGAIETTVASLDVTVTGMTAGSGVSIAETDGVTINNITTANGPITVTTGGATTVTNVVSTTDDDANDITITVSTGDIALGVVNAGSAAGDVSITATAGAITDSNAAANNITGDEVTLTSFGDIGSLADPLEVTANNFSFMITGAGTAFVTTNGNSTLNLSLLSGDLVYAVTGDLLIERAEAFGGRIDLAAGGSIYVTNDGVTLIALTDIHLVAGGVIGTLSAPIRFITSEGRVSVSAGGQMDNVSIHLIGNVRRSEIEYLNLPPGLALYNFSIAGGEIIRSLLPSTLSLYPDATPLRFAEYPGNAVSYRDFFPGMFSESDFTGADTLVIEDSSLNTKANPKLFSV